MGIRGNELADSLAKLASTHQEQFVSIHYEDWFPIIHSRITALWNAAWQRSEEKKNLAVKPSVGDWDTRFSNRGDQLFITRMCTGHSWITHHHLIDADMGAFAPPRTLCHRVAVSIKHLLIECTAFAVARRIFFDRPLSSQTLLTNRKYLANLITFGKHTGLYESVQDLWIVFYKTKMGNVHLFERDRLSIIINI